MSQSNARRLRLGPLPKTNTVKIPITLTVALKADLDRYAALHSQTWGERVDAAALVPHILENFIARDRAFRRAAAKPNLQEMDFARSRKPTTGPDGSPADRGK